MMNKSNHLPFATLLCLLWILTALFSWIGGVYGLPFQNLLAPEGIRWLLRSAATNIAQAPLIGILAALMGVGIWLRSGFSDAIAELLRLHYKLLSPKQRWALRLSLFVLMVYVLLLVWGIAVPHAILLSVTGGLMHSPFADGWLAWLTVGVSLSAGVYGWVSERFQTHADVIHALGYSIGKCADVFVTLFVAAQWVACLHYTGILMWCGFSDELIGVASIVLYVFPFVWRLVTATK